MDRMPLLNAVLLDDDDLILRTWALAARHAGVNLSVFSVAADFLTALAGLDCETEVYIDVNLGGQVTGQEIAKHARALGFQKIWLVTGYPAQRFADMPWVKMLDKNPPWREDGL